MIEEKHILSLLVDNQPGVLARIASLFSGRGYNIENFNDVYNRNVALNSAQTLTRQNNQTNWRQLLENRSQHLYL